jgi:hypothetical protein
MLLFFLDDEVESVLLDSVEFSSKYFLKFVFSISKFFWKKSSFFSSTSLLGGEDSNNW